MRKWLCGLLFATLLVAAAAPTNATTGTHFQADTGPAYGSSQLQYPHLIATTGARPGVATISVSATKFYWGVTVRWFSLGTGASGTVRIPGWLGTLPLPPRPQQDFEIRPGPGQVVAIVEGGIFPGFGTFSVS